MKIDSFQDQYLYKSLARVSTGTQLIIRCYGICKGKFDQEKVVRSNGTQNFTEQRLKSIKSLEVVYVIPKRKTEGGRNGLVTQSSRTSLKEFFHPPSLRHQYTKKSLEKKISLKHSYITKRLHKEFRKRTCSFSWSNTYKERK